MVLVLEARIAEEARTRRWIETGDLIAPTQTWEVHAAELDHEVRSYLVERMGWERIAGGETVRYVLCDFAVDSRGRIVTEPHAVEVHADPIMELRAERERYLRARAAQQETAGELVREWVRLARAWTEGYHADRPPEQEPQMQQNGNTTCIPADVLEALTYCPDLRREVEQVDAELCAAIVAFRARQQEADAVNAQEVRRGMEEWIATHGSDYLRRLAAAGYDVSDAYRAERIKADYPGFCEAPPFARWQRCSSPSPAALDLAEAVGGTVVAVGLHEHDALRETVIVEPAWWPGLLVLRVIDSTTTGPDKG